MTDTAQQQLITDIARDVITQTAPHELPLFRASSEAYFKNPEKFLNGEAGKVGSLAVAPQ